MSEFDLCSFCRTEYEDPMNRRYHAQPVSCPENGPKYTLYKGKNPIQTDKAIKKAVELIQKDEIIITKGTGGMHLVCNASNNSSRTIKKLRSKTKRKTKPFAIMARDLETVKKFAKVTEKEKEELTSYRKPITLLQKKQNFKNIISNEIAPDLHNVGVMLPYTGLHHLLFKYLKTPAIVMTSANMPGKPMITKNNKAREKLSNITDHYLLHNREILNRTDDSVVRFVNNQRSIIRRSRGFVPQSLETRFNYNGLALGAELMNTISLIKSGNIFPSQHLGNTSNLEIMKFLKETLRHLKNLLELENFDMIISDLHPLFNTTELGKELSEEMNTPYYQVQHHVAHAGTLLTEYPEDEMIVIDADGAGYGWDGKTWGGEVFHISKNEIKRTHHIDYYPLPGADKAAKNPIRSLIGILSQLEEEYDIPSILNKPKKTVKYGEKEISVIKDQIKKEVNLAYTSSTGRFLDALSCLLDICCTRNYEGEAAIKLESSSINGKDLGWRIPIENNLIKAQEILPKIIRSNKTRRDIGYTVHKALARSFAEAAIKSAKEHNVDTIGFTGGVSYNDILSSEINKICKNKGFKFRQTNKIPRGDAGVSVGQAYFGGLIKEDSLDPKTLIEP